MAVTSAANPAEHIGLQEWLRLRRPPRPEFYQTLDELPAGLADQAQSSLPADHAVRGVLAVPGEYRVREKVHWVWAPERALIFMDGAALYVSAATEDTPPQAVLFDAQALLYLRSSLILLYGLLEFKADCGAAGDVRLEYNTVIWEALRRPLTRFVADACPRTLVADTATAAAQSTPIIKSLPFKFANGVRYYALDAGEVLQAAVFQPALWQRRGILPREISPNTVFALTDRKVVLIEEMRSLGWMKRRSESEYGWIFTYIPRDRVVDVTVAQDARWAELRISLAWGGAKDERTFLLEPAIAARWREAWFAAQLS